MGGLIICIMINSYHCTPHLANFFKVAIYSIFYLNQEVIPLGNQSDYSKQNVNKHSVIAYVTYNEIIYYYYY